MKKMGLVLGVAMFGMIVLGFSGYVPAAESQGQPLTYRLKWLFNVSVIGDLNADVNGYFKNEGFEVTVKEGGPERDAIRELELGYADFGVASADQVIRALSKGAPVVVLAQLFQINPLQWVYRPDQLEINRLTDLKSRIIGITFGGNDEAIMRTLLAKGGLTEDDVRIYSVRYDYTPFYRRKVDMWPVYVNSQGPIIAKKLGQAGETVSFFNPSDHGVQFVANSVVTSKKMIEGRPETVKGFVRGLLMGWEAALDPDKADRALDMLAGFDKDTPRPILEKQLTLTRELVKPTAAVRIGKIDIQAWKQTERIMLEQGQIKKPVGVENVIVPLEAN